MYEFVTQCLQDFVNNYETLETHDGIWTENDGLYVDKELLPDICKHIKNKFTTTYVYKDSKIRFTLGYIKTKKCGNYTYDVLLRFINFLVHMFGKIKGHIPKEMNITIADYCKKKTMPAKGSLTSKYVNSGLTVYDISHVCVYRREEVIKVLIHEMIHLFNIDSKYGSRNTRIDDIFCRNNININESFTDGLACYLNCIICSIVHKTSFKNNLRKERKHILEMASKVYKYYGLQEKCSNKMDEQTNTVAYYVVKGILFHNFDLFEKYLVKHNFMLQNLDSFKDLLLQSYTDNYRQTLLSYTAKDRQLKMSLISLKSKGI